MLVYNFAELVDKVQKCLVEIKTRMQYYEENDGSIDVPTQDVSVVLSKLVDAKTYFEYIDENTIGYSKEFCEAALSALDTLIQNSIEHRHRAGNLVIPKDEVELTKTQIKAGMEYIDFYKKSHNLK